MLCYCSCSYNQHSYKKKNLTVRFHNTSLSVSLWDARLQWSISLIMLKGNNLLLRPNISINSNFIFHNEPSHMQFQVQTAISLHGRCVAVTVAPCEPLVRWRGEPQPRAEGSIAASVQFSTSCKHQPLPAQRTKTCTWFSQCFLFLLNPAPFDFNGVVSQALICLVPALVLQLTGNKAKFYP